MTDGLQVIDTNGEVLSIDNVLTKLNDVHYLASLPNEQIEQLAYIVQAIKSPTKKIDDELKDRLKKGGQFDHISLTEAHRTTIEETKEVRDQFYDKYGLEAFVLRTPTQLKKKFGEAVETDIKENAKTDISQRVKYD